MPSGGSKGKREAASLSAVRPWLAADAVPAGTLRRIPGPPPRIGHIGSFRWRPHGELPVTRFLKPSACILAAGSAAFLAPPAAHAHPHILVDAHAEIVFDASGKITAIRNIWQFDDAFTAFAVQGLDANNDGELSDDELQPLAKVNIDSLSEYEFFTWLTVGETTYKFVPPTEYWLEFYNSRLTLFFTLPLEEPVAVGPGATLEVFDPEYFVAFTFPKKEAVKLDGAPQGCKAVYHPPRELDAQTMATLSAIPADQHDLPPALEDAASALTNLIKVACS